MKTWRILSDNLIGALEVASAWADGPRVPVFLDAPLDAGQPVQALSTSSRSLPEPEMEQRLSQALNWFTGAEGAFKKIDTLLRGNSIAELAWLMHQGKFAGAVLATADPGNGRFTAQGVSWIASANQPYGPRTYENVESLTAVLNRAGLNIHIPAQIGQSLDKPGNVVVPSLLTHDDLNRLADLAAQPQASQWLWCGGTGLAKALARQHFPSLKTLARPVASLNGRALLLTTSQHPMFREQLQELALKSHPLDIVDLSDNVQGLRQQIHDKLGLRIRALVAHRKPPSLLLVIGGFNLLALCLATGARSLTPQHEPHPGWGSAQLNAGIWDGLTCHYHSGSFTPADNLSALFENLLPASSVSAEAYK